MSVGRDWRSEDVSERALPDYEIEVILKFSITDANALWLAAARRLEEQGLDRDDIEDTLGPMADPTIDDCLLTLALPGVVEGCQLEQVEANRTGAAPVAVADDVDVQKPQPSVPATDDVVDTGTDWRARIDVPVLRARTGVGGPDHLSSLPN